VTLALPDKWLWDFWTAEADGYLHVFYLQADRALLDPDLRHWNVSIGHAVSRDLDTWEVLPDAFGPSPGPAWDDRSTWTGSVIRTEHGWAMLYTGTSRAEDGLVQRVGLATSPDLLHWERQPGPVMEADPRWYELLDLDAWFDHAWRDPWVFRGPDGAFHAYVTARAPRGPARGRAVIGHARSDDLTRWEVLPPVTRPMGFGQMEVPQLLEAGGRWYLLFSSDPGTRTPASGAEGVGTYALSADTPFGPFEHATLHAVDAGPPASSAPGEHAPYAGKVVSFNGALQFLGWEGVDGGGAFRGTLARPRAVSVTPDGRLAVGGEQ